MQISLVSLIEKATSGIPFRYVHLGGVYGRRDDHIIYVRTGKNTDEFDSAMRENGDAFVMATGHPGAELSRIGFPMPVPQDVLILCTDDLQAIYNKHHK
ncbi:MAG: hypothetical protein NC405_09405 [Odoribacter sp.]|nr:hypothetical protein [Odoribacter sp.]